MEGAVRQDQGRREVVGDADAGEAVGGRAGLEVLGGLAVEFVAVLEQGELGRHTEGALARAQATGQAQGAGCLVVAVQVFARVGREADAVGPGQAIRQCLHDLAGPDPDLLGQALGREVGVVEVVLAAVEEVPDLLVG